MRKFSAVTRLNSKEAPVECTPEKFHSILNSERVASVCGEISDLLEAVRRGTLAREEFEKKKDILKRSLPGFCFQATYGGKSRKIVNATPSGLVMYDVDHICNPRGYWEAKAQLLEGKGLKRYVGLAHITPSTEGLHIVFLPPRGMSIAEAQRWMSAQLEDTAFDRACKDLARGSYAVPADYVLYEDDDVLFGDAEAPEGDAGLNDPHAGVSLADTRTPERHLDKEPFPQDYNGTPYGLIVDRLVEQLGGVPAHGSRNNFIFTLACHLRYLCDDNAAWIKSIIPTFGELRSKVDTTVESACNRQQTPVMPAIVKRALLLAKRDSEAPGTDTGSQPPALPKRLPKLVKLLIKYTPDIYKPAVASAVFPSLAAHLWHTQFRYIDNKLHEATLMNVLMAGTGAGKDCISDPIDYIMADIRERDAKNMQREREWKEEMNTKGANKDKRKRPEGLIIQEVDPDMTNPAFVMRMAEAEEHFLFSKMNELDQFDALRGSGRGGQQYRIMCLAFDPNNRYGQTRVGTQSVTERVTVRFNWNATTTIQKGQRYFADVLTDGPISRINFCTIPEREIGSPIPVYGTYGPDFGEKLKPYIERLCDARGIIEIPQAERLARRLNQELAEFATLSDNRTFENLSFRANVIAWLKGCVLYVAQGCKWDKTIEDFVRWSLRYDLWCKMRFFGDAITQAANTAPRSSARGPQNLLQQLPDEFTKDDVVRVRLKNGLDTKSANHMIDVWKNRKYIVVLSDNLSISYRKLKFRQDGIDITKNEAVA